MGLLPALQAGRDPDRPAVTIGDEQLTRGELERSANRLARWLAAAGVGEQAVVALLVGGDGTAAHVATFAVWKLGATPLPLSSKLPPAERQAILRLAEPALVLACDGGSEGDHRPLPGEAALAAFPDAPHPPRVARHRQVIASGGSSGRPKLIVDLQPSLIDPAQIPAGLLMHADDVILHPAPLHHSGAFKLIHMALCWGAHVVRMPAFDPLEWLRLVERHRIRWAYMVPTMMHRVWQLPADDRRRFDLSSLEVVVHMAAPCPPWLKRAWIDWLGPDRIWEVYSASEGIGSAVIGGREWLERPGSVGRPQGPVRILDEAGRDCAPGTVGEIYFRQPEARSPYAYVGAAARRIDDWESLGDLGRLDADGYLYIADRRTDLIISGGANIYPAEIEAALDEHPAIAASAVVARPDPDLGARPHAIIELVADAPPPPATELEAFLAVRLARYKLPYSYEFAAEELRTSAGKLQRFAHRDRLAARLAAGERFALLKGGTA